MKQTAVEWLINELIRVGYFENIKPNITFEQAKEMEKYQIENAFYKGIQEQTARALINSLNTSPEEYYNKTFKNK